METSKYLDFNKKIGKVDFDFIGKDNRKYYAKDIIKKGIGLRILRAYSESMLPGSKKVKKNVQQLDNLLKFRKDLINLFRFFIRGNWVYQNENLYKVMSCLSAEELTEFNADC